jgi:hypothetical protein
MDLGSPALEVAYDEGKDVDIVVRDQDRDLLRGFLRHRCFLHALCAGSAGERSF